MERVADAPPKYVSRLYTPMAHLTDPTRFQLLIKVGARVRPQRDPWPQG